MRAAKRSAIPRQRQNANSTHAASPKRIATPNSGASTSIWAVMANHVVPQIRTHTEYRAELGMGNECPMTNAGLPDERLVRSINGVFSRLPR